MAATRSSDVDHHVRKRIHERRREIGMSQEKLGNALGVSFQQIQKYEAGIDRVMASRLWDIAEALEVDQVGYFFEGIQKRAKRKAKPRKRSTAAKAKRTKPRKRQFLRDTQWLVWPDRTH